MEVDMTGRLPAWVGLATLLFATAVSSAAIKTQLIDYQQGGVDLQGYLAYDDSQQGPRPGVLICHEWWGLNDYPKHRAEQLAQLGYVAFALDMYGKGVTATTPQDAMKLSQIADDRYLIRQRAAAALDLLRKQPQCDPAKVAVIGYCFGGMVALELARGGADVAAVVSFHGSLASPLANDDQPIKARILVCTGADDAFVPPKDVEDFKDEMRKDGADYQIISYGGAVHAFTNPDADKVGMKNVAYNAAADKRSWAAMRAFFDEVFGPVK
jgi:dienelactone hydrolase